MRQQYANFLALLLALLMIFLPLAEISGQQLPMKNITIYAHTDYYLGAPEGRLLSTAPPYGNRQSAIIDKAISFFFYPPLRTKLLVQGTISFRGWFKASEDCQADVRIVLFEVSADGRAKDVRGFGGSLIRFENRVSPSLFAVGEVLHEFKEGSLVGVRIAVENCPALPVMYWDHLETPTQLVLPVLDPTVTAVNVRALDYSGKAVVGANITLSKGLVRVWNGKTNSTGWVTIYVLPSGIGDRYNLTAHVAGQLVNSSLNVDLSKSPILLRSRLFDLTITFRTPIFYPLTQAAVRMFDHRSDLVAQGNTTADGSINFSQIPSGNYTIQVARDRDIQTFEISISGSVKRQLFVSFLPREALLNTALALIATISAVGVFVKLRMRRFKVLPFNFFRGLVGGKIPPSSVVMVSGNSGAGKSVFMEHLLHQGLKEDSRSCVYIVNTDFPYKIRERMDELGIGVDAHGEKSKLIFIDCYSGSAGQHSKEELSVSSMTDLTTLGVQITSCLKKLGSNADVFFDSLGPLVPMIKPDNVMSFVQSMGAKVRGNQGRFFFTVGPSVPREFMNKLEESADCIVEVGVFEEKGRQRRRLRVKKMRGRYVERWVDFSVQPKRGMLFRVRRNLLRKFMKWAPS